MKALGAIRDRHKFSLVDYVVMPEHVHLLVSEPPKSTPSTLLKVLKQRVARDLRKRTREASCGQLRLAFMAVDAALLRFWQPRFHDLNAAKENGNSVGHPPMTIGSAAGFFTLGRAIPDGQGGTLLTVWSPPMLYHASSSGVSKFALPIFPDEPPGDDLFAADSMLLGEDGTAYIVGSSSEEAPIDTVLAIDSNTGATNGPLPPACIPNSVPSLPMAPLPSNTPYPISPFIQPSPTPPAMSPRYSQIPTTPTQALSFRVISSVSTSHRFGLQARGMHP